MADVGPDQVAAGVVAAWNGSADARVYCPGGIWHGRVPQSAGGTPYARLTVSQGDTKRFGGGRYLRTFAVRISIWGDNGAAGDVADLRAAAAALMTRANLTVPGAVKLTDLKPGPNEMGVDESPRNADDVSMMNLEFTLTVEGQ